MKRCLVLAALFLAGAALSQAAPQKIDGPLTVAEAIRVALQNNPTLAAAHRQFDAAHAGLREAKAALFPQISANSFATAGSYNTIVNSSAGVMPPNWLTIPNGGFVDQNLTLMIPLFTGGKLEARVRSASWQERAARGELAEMHAAVSLNVKDDYLKASVAKQMTAVQAAKVTAVQELLRTTQAKFVAGKDIEASVQRVQAELSRANRSLTSARNNVAKALLDLDAVMGVDFTSAISLSDELVLAPEEGTQESYLRIARTSRGKLLASRARAEAAGADVRGAESERFPQFYAQAMGDVASNRMGTGASFGLTLSFPLFDGGRIGAEVAGAKAQRAKAQADVTETEIAVENEIRQVWLDIETSKANAESAQASVGAAQSAYDVVALRVSSGKGILVEELDALQALTEAKADLAQATYEHNLAMAKLIKAAGGAK